MEPHALLDGPASRIQPVARSSMRDVIAGRLAALIGSGALSVGDPLPSERELASAMAVSRETIRGALAILSTRGIVSVAQGARTTVASDDVGELGLPRILPISKAESARPGGYVLDDIHETRLVVEASIARLATPRIDADTLQRLEDLIAAQEDATDDPLRFLILDREFHALIYRASDNRVLSDLAITLYSYLLDHRRRIVARAGSVEQSIQDHRTILDALERGDAEAAAQAFGVHERRIYETTRELIKQAEPDRPDQREDDREDQHTREKTT